MKEKISKFCGFLVDFSVFSILLVVPVYFSFVSETWNIFELPKVVFFRYLLALGILAWLLRVVLSGSFKYKFPKIVFWILAGLALSALVSVSLSIHPGLSFWGKYQRQQGFFSLLSYLFFFLLSISAMRDLKKVKIFFGAAIMSSFVACFYGLLQFLYLDPMNWAEPFELHLRVFSSLGQPNFFGHYLIMIIPLTVYCLFFMTNKFLARFVFLLLIVLELACLYYTKSRSAWLALMGEFWFAIVFWLAFSKRKKVLWSFLAASLFFLVIVFSVAMMPKDYNGFRPNNRLFSALNLSVGSTQMRMYYWLGAINEFVHTSWSRKIFGYGQDVLSDVTVKWYKPTWSVWEKLNMWPDRAHNLILDVLMSLGVVGLLAYGWAFFYFTKRVVVFFRTNQREEEYWLMIFLCLAIVGYLVNNFFSFSMTPQYVYFYFFLAAISCLLFSSYPEKTVLIRFSPLSRGLIFFSAAFFLAIFVFYRGAAAMKADYYFAAARDQEGSSNCDALEFNRTAIILNPEESVYREEYVFNALNCFERMKELADKKTLQENIILTMSSLPEKEKGYYAGLEEANSASLFAYHTDKSFNKEAEERFLTMIERYPNISQVYLYYAYHKLRQGDFAAVDKLAIQGEAVLPKFTLPIDKWNPLHLQDVASEWARFYDLAGSAAERTGNYSLAIENYKKLLKTDPFQLVIYKKIADVYYQKKDLESALWYNKRGYSLNRHDYSWPMAIGFLLSEKGDWLEAEKYLSESINLNPDNKNAKEKLEEVKKNLKAKVK